MRIEQFEPGDRRRAAQFLRLPFVLYRDTPQWAPPLCTDASQPFNPRNPFYQHSQAAFFLALDGERTTGRLAVLDNAHYNAFNHTHSAFFCLFECENDAGTARALFDAAAAWAQARGLDALIGPKGFTALDGLGLLVRGFEHPPAFGIPYNLPTYPALIEAAGFAPDGEIVSGYLSAAAPFPERIHRLSELVQRRRGLHVARFRTRRDLRALVPKLRDLYNNSLGGTAGNTPLTDAEARSLGNQLLWFADPKLIKIVMRGDEPVGFLFAYPDITAALQRTGGRLWPLGWWRLWRELRRTRWVNINGAGIVEQYRGLGGTAILFSEMHRSIVEGGFAHAEIVQVGVENDPMQRELADLGIRFYKSHRMYRRQP